MKTKSAWLLARIVPRLSSKSLCQGEEQFLTRTLEQETGQKTRGRARGSGANAADKAHKREGRGVRARALPQSQPDSSTLPGSVLLVLLRRRRKHPMQHRGENGTRNERRRVRQTGRHRWATKLDVLALATMTKKKVSSSLRLSRVSSGPFFAPSFRHGASETANGTSTSRSRVSGSEHGAKSPREKTLEQIPCLAFSSKQFLLFDSKRLSRAGPPLFASSSSPKKTTQLTEDGGRVDGGGGPDAAVGRGAELELAVDAADREGQAGPGRARNRLLLVARGALAGTERALVGSWRKRGEGGGGETRKR